MLWECCQEHFWSPADCVCDILLTSSPCDILQPLRSGILKLLTSAWLSSPSPAAHEGKAGAICWSLCLMSRGAGRWQRGKTWAVVTPKAGGPHGLYPHSFQGWGWQIAKHHQTGTVKKKKKNDLKLFGIKENHRKKRSIRAIPFAVLEKLRVQFLLCSSGQQKLTPLKPVQNKISINLKDLQSKSWKTKCHNRGIFGGGRRIGNFASQLYGKSNSCSNFENSTEILGMTLGKQILGFQWLFSLFVFLYSQAWGSWYKPTAFPVMYLWFLSKHNDLCKKRVAPSGTSFWRQDVLWQLKIQISFNIYILLVLILSSNKCFPSFSFHIKTQAG